MGPGIRTTLLRWVDSYAGMDREIPPEESSRIDWLRVIPFFFLHAACLLVLLTGWSATALAVAGLLYVGRIFAITGFYHRYFSHRTFKTGRAVQFVFALLGNMSAQRGPLWWAGHHRHHHRFSDRPEDVHSPRQRGFLYSHMGWFLTKGCFRTDFDSVKCWLGYPELVFLDRFDILAPLLMIAGLFGLGTWLGAAFPGLGTSGLQLAVWGGVVSTVLVMHGTFTINSLCHVWGRRRYDTGDDSRNNLVLALITLGEGWHNNHHHYPVACRQGIYPREIDITFGVLRLMSFLGLVRDLHPVPEQVMDRDRIDGKTG